MRRIFILEDDPERVLYFKETLSKVADITVIDTCADADQFEPPYDAIFLDHDLGGRQMEDHEDCGRMFIELVLDRLTDHDMIVVHSYNSAGAKRMLELLPDTMLAVYTPFRGPTFNLVIEELLKLWERESTKKATKKDGKS